MKRLLSMLLVVALLAGNIGICSCGEYAGNFRGMNDAALRDYLAESVYETLLSDLDTTEYIVSDIKTIYISQEYLDEHEFNSQTNVYFGYSIAELDEQFQGTRYVFTLGDDGQTTVKAVGSYDDTYERVLHNVAVGSGVILVCVTVSVLTAGSASTAAVSMIFAVGAKTGTACALSGATIGAVSSGIVTGIRTGNMDEALKAAARDGSEGFKWGAITGVVSGAAAEAAGLYSATLNPNSALTMNDVAVIQRESKLPLSMIKYMHSMDEYRLYKEAGVLPTKINGSYALTQKIDLNIVDEYGRSNVERIKAGLAPIDSNGLPYELHHIGQSADSPLAILTQGQHRSAGNYSILHFNTGGAVSDIEREVFSSEKVAFWKAYLKQVGGI